MGHIAGATFCLGSPSTGPSPTCLRRSTWSRSSAPLKKRPEIARQAVAIGARALWLQLGIRSEEARQIAEAGGLDYVEDRCMGVERPSIKSTSARQPERPRERPPLDAYGLAELFGLLTGLLTGLDWVWPGVFTLTVVPPPPKRCHQLSPP